MNQSVINKRQVDRRKIPDAIWQKLYQLIKKIPKVQSHYDIDKSEKEYWDYPSLNITLLYEGWIQILQ